MSLLLERVRVGEIAIVLGLTEAEAMRRARRVVAMLQANVPSPSATLDRVG
jgi:hypothetical protein